MANTNLTASIIAAEALRILENECVTANLVYRGYEEEFDKTVNGYTVGATINVRRPADFVVRTGRTVSVQDVTEGQFPITVDRQRGVDFNFTSLELTQNIKSLSERVIRPAMIQLANRIDSDLLGLYPLAYHWLTTTSAVININTFSAWSAAAERLDLMGVPQDDRKVILNPTNYWSLGNAAPTLFMQDVAKDMYRRGMLGDLAGIDVYKSQNVATHTRGTAVTATLNSLFSTTYALTLNSNTMSIALQFATTQSIAAGDVFQIGGIFAVNPVTKATQNYLQQFVVVTAAGGTAAVTVTITPPIITTGAFQTVSAAPTASSVVTFMGLASGVYPQNLAFHRNAMSLVMVPMVRPPGAVDVSRQTYKGYSVRVIPGYTHADDISVWRLDVLYGIKMLDPRMLVRVNGV
jgi:hypothetical protein